MGVADLRRQFTPETTADSPKSHLSTARRPPLPHPNPSIAQLPGRPQFSWTVHLDNNTDPLPVPDLTSSPCTSITSSGSPHLRSQTSASASPQQQSSQHSSWDTQSASASSTPPDVEYPSLLPQPLCTAPSVMARKRPVGSRNSSAQALRSISSNITSRFPPSIEEEEQPGGDAAKTNHFSFEPLRLPRRRQKQSVEEEPRSNSIVSVATINTAKDLPLSPPQLASVDLVTSLEAQLDEMRYRRRNLEKMAQSVMTLQPQNPLVQDLAARRASKEQMDAYKAELADVKQQEHGVGLRLHRAYKRRDHSSEPSAFWVRRIATL